MLRLTKSLVVSSGLLLGFLAFCIFPSNPVSAVTAADWNAANIMDDSIFFNSSSMSTNDIQIFLNNKVPTCNTWHAASNGNNPPFTCLKDYLENPETHQNNANGGGVSGGWSAAQIIKHAADSYNINPKVLIVLLQKEQSLITDDWPWLAQYRSATGFGCPDTAPCDAEYYGFYNQVMNAAKQFRRYATYPSEYRYKAHKSNFIQYNPSIACGGSNVTIANQTTAGLYNYTPYQPNASALANLYGSGDSCGAYGNRNFWRMFNDWFGSVNGAAYEWQLISQESYSDPARTQPFTSFTTALPGQKIYLRIKVRNTGFQTWDSSSMRLGTSNPRDRISIMQDPSWLNSSRPSQLKEASVQPSEIGTFDFVVNAPSTTGTYLEYFTPVADGITWLKDIGMYYHINVVSLVSPLNTQKIGLNPEQSLELNDYILSPDTQSSLVVQNDGNLVMYTNLGKPVWNTGTQGQAKRLVMQGDGNLVLYSQNSIPMWNSGTNGNPNSRLTLQTDGNLVIYSQSNVALWSAGIGHNPDHLRYVNTHLSTGVVYPGQSLETANRKYKMIFQTDGNLVVYSPNRAVWSSGTWGNTNARMVMQGDGNLVIYSKTGQALWNTRTSMHGSSFMVLQQDGNAILYNANYQPTWASNTSGQQ